MSTNNDFWRKNFSWFHLFGMLAGLTLSLLYWYKSGQFSENILKNSPVLMSLWGILTGYILMDLVRNSANKKDEN